MTVLSAQSIAARGIVSPCVVSSRDNNGNSYGLSACGYDLRLDQAQNIPPGEMRLGSTMEKFRMPNDVVGIVHDKSSLARMGLSVFNTVIEPGWEGYLTLELANHTKFFTFDIEAGSAIAQVIFHMLDQPTELPYSGKYQNQKRGPQEAI